MGEAAMPVAEYSSIELGSVASRRSRTQALSAMSLVCMCGLIATTFLIFDQETDAGDLQFEDLEQDVRLQELGWEQRLSAAGSGSGSDPQAAANKKFRAAMRKMATKFHKLVKKEKSIVDKMNINEVPRLRANLVADLQYIHNTSHPQPKYMKTNPKVISLRKQLAKVKSQIHQIKHDMDYKASEHLLNKYIVRAYKVTSSPPYKVVPHKAGSGSGSGS